MEIWIKSVPKTIATKCAKKYKLQNVWSKKTQNVDFVQPQVDFVDGAPEPQKTLGLGRKDCELLGVVLNETNNNKQQAIDDIIKKKKKQLFIP